MLSLRSALVSLVATGVLRAQAPAPPVAITGVTIVDPAVAASKQAGLTNQTVVIRDGVIQAVGAAGTVTIPSGARRVDGRGKFLMPGLWDSHVHFMNTG